MLYGDEMTQAYMVYYKRNENKCSLGGGDKITDKQKKFAEEYVQCLNATKAYMKIYGTKNEKNASARGSRLKKNAEVGAYIRKMINDASYDAAVETRKILELLSAIAFTSPADFATITNEGGKQKIQWRDIEKLPEDVKKAIAVIKNTPSGISIETLDRMKAIDMLMRYLGIKPEGGAVIIEGEGELEE